MLRFLCLWFLLASAPAFAERHALLVGVSHVKAAQPSPILPSVANDLVLARDMAHHLGVAEAHVTVHSDTGAGRPATRAEVVRAMQHLKEAAQPGDFLLFYLTGHGVQQPSSASPGQLEEVFLLEDSQSWTAEAGVGNALSDREIRRWLADLDQKGVTVWMVADSCHAGSIARTLLEWFDKDIAFRAFKGLRAQWMGIRKRLQPTPETSPATGENRIRPSDFRHVSLFLAADAEGSALEVALRGDGRRVGLFTWALNRAVRQSALPVDAETLAKEILAGYHNYPAWVVRPRFEIGTEVRRFPSR